MSQPISLKLLKNFTRPISQFEKKITLSTWGKRQAKKMQLLNPAKTKSLIKKEI
jgi:hypothetical protein